ncbi:hypothetical protein HDU96_006629 [Phlyctochytrium bullatum]|nr:hypothetical protein HDU96_006629 [Phlyctochytrium bullatum]
MYRVAGSTSEDASPADMVENESPKEGQLKKVVDVDVDEAAAEEAEVVVDVGGEEDEAATAADAVTAEEWSAWADVVASSDDADRCTIVFAMVSIVA